MISAVEHAFSDIQDAETGQRGFIITGDERYLDPHRHTLRTIPESLREVRKLVADRSEQLDRAANLEKSLHIKLDELNATIALRRNADLDATRAAIVQAEGKASMDHIRAVVAEMISTEKNLLSDRTSTVAHQERNVLLVAVFGAGLSVATRIVLELVVFQRRTRQEAESGRGIRS